MLRCGTCQSSDLGFTLSIERQVKCYYKDGQLCPDQSDLRDDKELWVWLEGVWCEECDELIFDPCDDPLLILRATTQEVNSEGFFDRVRDKLESLFRELDLDEIKAGR